MTTRHYTGLADTETGRTRQLNKAFRGMAEDMKNRAVVSADCDDPTTLPAALRVIESLRQQLADAQALIDEMRTEINSDAPAESAVVSTKAWTTRQVVERSGVSVSTITRNAQSLGGWQLESGDWMFPVGTIYGRRRKSK